VTPNAVGGGSASAPVVAIDFSSAVRNVSGQVRPAVVQITNEQTQVSQMNQAFTIPTGVGSGIIYDNNGHILTNNHVIEGAQTLLVSLPDGRSFTAKLIGADRLSDLAVIQISGSNLPVARLGDSSQLQVGDWVVAIGNALALPGGPTVTSGVVSALGRTVQEPSTSSSSQQTTVSGGDNQPPYLIDVIQTDAAINPGNSGGALANLSGEVIGINTLVAGQVQTGVQAEGIGFAISMAKAKPIADELVAAGKVAHAGMGLNFVALDPIVAAQAGISVPAGANLNGALVVAVIPGGAAAAAGIQVNDIITAVGNVQTDDDAALAAAIDSYKPGDKVQVTLLRNNQKMTVQLTMGTMP
jgi:serine protease Do